MVLRGQERADVARQDEVGLDVRLIVLRPRGRPRARDRGPAEGLPLPGGQGSRGTRRGLSDPCRTALMPPPGARVPVRTRGRASRNVRSREVVAGRRLPSSATRSNSSSPDAPTAPDDPRSFPFAEDPGRDADELPGSGRVHADDCTVRDATVRRGPGPHQCSTQDEGDPGGTLALRQERARTRSTTEPARTSRAMVSGDAIGHVRAIASPATDSACLVLLCCGHPLHPTTWRAVWLLRLCPPSVVRSRPDARERSSSRTQLWDRSTSGRRLPVAHGVQDGLSGRLTIDGQEYLVARWPQVSYWWNECGGRGTRGGTWWGPSPEARRGPACWGRRLAGLPCRGHGPLGHLSLVRRKRSQNFLLLPWRNLDEVKRASKFSLRLRRTPPARS